MLCLFEKLHRIFTCSGVQRSVFINSRGKNRFRHIFRVRHWRVSIASSLDKPIHQCAIVRIVPTAEISLGIFAKLRFGRAPQMA